MQNKCKFLFMNEWNPTNKVTFILSCQFKATQAQLLIRRSSGRKFPHEGTKWKRSPYQPANTELLALYSYCLLIHSN